MAISPRSPKTLSHLPSPSSTLLSKHAMQEYVYFSDNTKGHTGKAVKIKIDLFTRFAALVDPKTHDGQTVIRQIENLRMVNGASSGVHANVNSAFRFMLKVRNMQVFYAVLDGEENGRKEVFIGNIIADFQKNTDKPGLYAYDSFSRKYNNYKQTNLDGKIVYLNGQCADLEDAFIQAKKTIDVSHDRLALFFSPNNIINALGVWSNSTKAKQNGNFISQLRDVIKFNRDKKVGWVAEAEGAEVLSNAFDELNGSFPGHRFRLIDPLTNTPALLQKLKSKEIRPVSDEVAPVTYTGKNRATTIFMESQKQSIINALKMLRVRGYAEDPHLSMITDLEKSAAHTPLTKSKQSLTNTASLNKRVTHPKSTPIKTNKAALSFITALRKI